MAEGAPFAAEGQPLVTAHAAGSFQPHPCSRCSPDRVVSLAPYLSAQHRGCPLLGPSPRAWAPPLGSCSAWAVFSESPHPRAVMPYSAPLLSDWTVRPLGVRSPRRLQGPAREQVFRKHQGSSTALGLSPLHWQLSMGHGRGCVSV